MVPSKVVIGTPGTARQTTYDPSKTGQLIAAIFDAQMLGIAIFDNPKNLRHPTYWHARHYGLLAANAFGLKELLHDRHQDGSYAIAAGGSLTLRYRVFIHHGDFLQAHVADAYRQYAAGE